MSQDGKFSNPRPYRDEERQIEQAFRQVTGQEPLPKRPEPENDLQMTQVIRQVPQQETAVPQPVLSEEAQIEQAFQQVSGQNTRRVSRQSAPQPPKKDFDLLPEDIDSFFEPNAMEFDEEPLENTEPDFVDQLAAFLGRTWGFCIKNQKKVMIIACAAALLLIVGFIALFFAGNADPYDDVILDNVIIAGVNVGGMTKNEAVSAVKEATNHTYSSQDMVIDLSGTELRLSPKDTGAKLDVAAAVEEAYNYGRTGTQSERDQAQAASRTEEHIIGLLPYLGLKEDHILDTLIAYAEDSGSTLTQATYGLEGPEPELSADKFDETAPCQTLVITLGTPGIGFDANDVYKRVLDAYSLHCFLVTVDNVQTLTDPDPVDLEAIYEEFYIAPVNASVNHQDFETSVGSYGYGFDLKAAQKAIDAAEYGETVRIPMEYIAPEILNDDSFFRDTIGEYRTRTTGNDERTTNLRLACEAIHGTVLMPGETLSFSTSLNKAKGYQNAPEDTGLEPIAQGGVSQVSSTLYYAALLSDLEIVSRTAHPYVPSFIDFGFDATPDLKLRNSTGFPIRIDAEVTGGYVRIQIIGTEERDYYVMLDYTISGAINPQTEYQDFPYDNAEGYADGDVIQEGVNGYQIKNYKVKYSNKTGKELSSDFLGTTQYPAQNRILARVEPEPTTIPTTEATVPPMETTAPPETTVPPETTLPAAEPTLAPITDAPVAKEPQQADTDAILIP